MSPEFSRPLRIEPIGASPRELRIDADESERRALAERLGLAGIDTLGADLALSRRGELVFARGRLQAAVIQTCVVTGEPVPAAIDEPFEIVFQPTPREGIDGEEIELSESEMDVIFYDGPTVDVGEAVAETLALSLDPYPRAPGAEAALKEAGIKSEADAKAAASPFAILRKD